MTKQEEIKEGIKDILRENHSLINLDGIVAAIQRYEASQGVVIRVDRELPEIPEFDSGGVCIWSPKQCEEAQRDMLRAGYVVVESFIKEGR